MFKGDELDITVNEKLKSILGTHLFRGDKLDMIE